MERGPGSVTSLLSFPSNRVIRNTLSLGARRGRRERRVDFELGKGTTHQLGRWRVVLFGHDGPNAGSVPDRSSLTCMADPGFCGYGAGAVRPGWLLGTSYLYLHLAGPNDFWLLAVADSPRFERA